MNTFPQHEQQPNLQLVVFGGGGGGSVMTRGLVEALPSSTLPLLSSFEITTVAPTGDGGSATGDIRKAFGGPAVGDARKNLGAVASVEAAVFFNDEKGRFGPDGTTKTGDTLHTLKDQFLQVLEDAGIATDRPGEVLDEAFDQTKWLPNGLGGHTYTNLILNALRLRHGKLTPAIAEMGRWIGAPANVRILPVTEESHNVIMYDPAIDKILVGEGLVDEHAPADPDMVEVWLEAGPLEDRLIEDPREVRAYLAEREYKRAPQATREVVGSVALSNIALLAPGSPWTTHKPVLMPSGVPEALRMQQAREGLWVVVANLIEEKPGMTLDSHLRTVQSVTGRPITHLLHNTDTDGLPAGTIPLQFDPEQFDLGDAAAIGEALVDSHLVAKSANDPIAHLRSPGHHNAWRVVEVLRDRVLADLGSQAMRSLVAGARV
jgi:2-phospho-L-lactate transferase/gluconeogenesis factor (CofD/UPF0052 family)